MSWSLSLTKVRRDDARKTFQAAHEEQGAYRSDGPHQIVTGCGRSNCPDCLTRLFLELLKGRAGAVIESATFEHNLDGPIIVDDLRTGLRAGTFPEQGAILAAEGQLVEHLQALRDARE